MPHNHTNLVNKLCKEISEVPAFEKQYSICTLVTRKDEYTEMLESFREKGFTEDCCEYLWVDNTEGNKHDAFSAMNLFIKNAKGRYVIFCHQDIYLLEDDKLSLSSELAKLNKIDPKWACAGNAGTTTFLKNIGVISMPNITPKPIPNLPLESISLDENFIVINNIHSVSASGNMKGFHLYGIDICQNAISLGYTCYVINFHLFHKSLGTVDESFKSSVKQFQTILHRRKSSQYLQTVCTKFYVSASEFKTKLTRNRKFLRLARSIHKKKLYKSHKDQLKNK